MIVSNNRRLFADIAFGMGGAAIAFVATLTVTLLLQQAHLGLLAVAVVVVCWCRGWRAGIAAGGAGLFAIAFLLPPLLRLPAWSVGHVIRLFAFGLVAAVACLLAAASERARCRLAVVERNRGDLQQCLRAAQQLNRFWTWELDCSRSVWRWSTPEGSLRLQEYETVESWLAQVHPEDQERCRTALAEAVENGNLALEFRVHTPSGQHRMLARGFSPDNSERPSRLIGVSVELDANFR